MERIKTLLIDNGSETIEEYSSAFNRCDITVISLFSLTKYVHEKFDLVMLSDGSLVSAHKNLQELDLVKSTDTPVIGFCYGFQVLCVAHGATLTHLPEKREGLCKINTTTSHPIFDNMATFESIEKHQYCVKDIVGLKDITCHATSSDGCEIIEVNSKKQFGFQFHPEIDQENNQGLLVVKNLLNRWFPS